MGFSPRVSQERLFTRPNQCPSRRDDVGVWNTFKAWYLFPLHLGCSVVFVILMLETIDERDFWTGSPPSLVERKGGLYQADINGLISAVLVALRLLGSCNAAIIVWRLIYILLEKSGLTLNDLGLMASWKVPIVPRRISRSQLIWSCYAFVVMILLWPPSVAAPLANSSLSWIPSTRDSTSPGQPYNISTFSSNSSTWDGFLYPHVITPGILKASLMISQDPDYAFVALNESRIPLKRYVYETSLDFEHGGVGNMSLPYFEVTNIKWLDAPVGRNLANLDNASMLEANPSPELFANAGVLGFLRESKWDYNAAIPLYKASAKSTFEGKRNISIFVGAIDLENLLDDGSVPTIETPCSKSGEVLGRLPPVIQHGIDIYVGEVWRAKRCYMLAEVTLKAGMYPNRRINITRVGSSTKMHMAIPLDPTEEDPKLDADHRILPVLDMLSDVTRLITYMDLTPHWQKNNSIDNYVAGMLTTAYHATWSALPMATDNETVTLVAFERVIRAEVSKTRLYIWLFMNSTLALAALMTAAAGHFCVKAKMIRDTTLAAITLDLGRIAHKHKNGLCNAVAFSKRDDDLGRLKWRGDTDFELVSEDNGRDKQGCCKELA